MLTLIYTYFIFLFINLLFTSSKSENNMKVYSNSIKSIIKRHSNNASLMSCLTKHSSGSLIISSQKYSIIYNKHNSNKHHLNTNKSLYNTQLFNFSLVSSIFKKLLYIKPEYKIEDLQYKEEIYEYFQLHKNTITSTELVQILLKLGELINDSFIENDIQDNLNIMQIVISFCHENRVFIEDLEIVVFYISSCIEKISSLLSQDSIIKNKTSISMQIYNLTCLFRPIAVNSINSMSDVGLASVSQLLCLYPYVYYNKNEYYYNWNKILEKLDIYNQYFEEKSLLLSINPENINICLDLELHALTKIIENFTFLFSSLSKYREYSWLIEEVDFYIDNNNNNINNNDDDIIKKNSDSRYRKFSGNKKVSETSRRRMTSKFNMLNYNSKRGFLFDNINNDQTINDYNNNRDNISDFRIKEITQNINETNELKLQLQVNTFKKLLVKIITSNNIRTELLLKDFNHILSQEQNSEIINKYDITLSNYNNLLILIDKYIVNFNNEMKDYYKKEDKSINVKNLRKEERLVHDMNEEFFNSEIFKVRKPMIEQNKEIVSYMNDYIKKTSNMIVNQRNKNNKVKKPLIKKLKSYSDSSNSFEVRD